LATLSDRGTAGGPRDGNATLGIARARGYARPPRGRCRSACVGNTATLRVVAPSPRRQARRSRRAGRDLLSPSRGSPGRTRMRGSLCPDWGSQPKGSMVAALVAEQKRAQRRVSAICPKPYGVLAEIELVPSFADWSSRGNAARCRRVRKGDRAEAGSESRRRCDGSRGEARLVPSQTPAS
jgi:hypothetical protein